MRLPSLGTGFPIAVALVVILATLNLRGTRRQVIAFAATYLYRRDRRDEIRRWLREATRHLGQLRRLPTTSSRPGAMRMSRDSRVPSS